MFNINEQDKNHKISFVHTDNGGTRRDGSGGATVHNGKIYFTPEGGIALKMVAGETLVRGEVVYINPTGAYAEAWKAPINSDLPFGTVYDATATVGKQVWVTYIGVGYGRPEIGAAATQGHIAYVSNSERGRLDNSSSIPAVEFHNREVGHYMENGAGNNQPARMILHFN